MNDSTPKIPLFSRFPDTAAAHFIPNGLLFEWTRSGVGCGTISLTVENGKLTVDTECMSPEFCAGVIKQAIEEALEDEV